MDDHRSANFSGAGGIGLLVLIRSLGEGHQDGGSPAHRQFAEAAGASSADGKVGMLQQAWNLIAEGTLRQQRMLHLAHLGVVAAGEVHRPAALLQQLRQDRSHHAVEANRSLAAADHHQQRPLPSWHPVRQRVGVEEAAADRHPCEQWFAAGDAF